MLVRHGQSQWNASGRIQGSSDESLLSQKGRKQAEAARKMVRFRRNLWLLHTFRSRMFIAHHVSACTPDLAGRAEYSSARVFTSIRECYSQLEGEQFDAFFSSPLQRAAVTGDIIWGGRAGSAQVSYHRNALDRAEVSPAS